MERRAIRAALALLMQAPGLTVSQPCHDCIDGTATADGLREPIAFRPNGLQTSSFNVFIFTLHFDPGSIGSR